MSETARDRWVRQEAEALAPVLEPLGYTAAECRRLAEITHDLDVAGTSGDGRTPEQVVLRELLLMQGLDTATADILSQTLPRLDWAKIEIGGRAASLLLGVSRNSLLQNMLNDRVPAWNVIMSGDKQDVITYSLARILFTHAWRRRAPKHTAPGVSTYPPAEYNAARFAIARRRRAQQPSNPS